MPQTEATRAPGSTTDGARYAAHVASLRHALEVAGDRLDPQIAAHAHAVLAGADERLALGVDHTVVALAGGTGSGKSSTFNALSRLSFADVGARRPTTARVTACAWSDDAGALLDWLEVDPERRIIRGSELDAQEEQPLTGLILLDLPDHDSVKSAHREIVDRILPLVDLLVWVVDPQKYADEALHAGYLRGLAGAEASMIVVLNQIDTVAETARPAIVADVARLLEEDGLVGVDVRTISARTGEGVGELRETLREAVARRSVAAGRLADELDREGRRIAEEVPATAVQDARPLLVGETDRLAAAVGVAAVVDDVRGAVRFGGTRQSGPPTFRAPQESALRVVRSRWVTRVSEGMRPTWVRSVDAAVPAHGELSSAIVSALADVPVDLTGSPGARRAGILAWVLGGLAIIAAVVALLVAVGVVDVPGAGLLAVAVLALLLAAGTATALVVATRLRSALAESRAQDLRTAAQAALSGVAERMLVGPAQTVLDEHADVRRSALAVRETSSTGAAPTL